MNIPIYRPFVAKNTAKYVNQCLEENWISSKGRFIQDFQDSFSEYLGVSHSSTVTNGTVALHLALLSLGIGSGDEVIVPNFTYIASVNAIAYVGAKPVFVDADEQSWNLDTSMIEKKITQNTKAIMAVHIYGNPSNMRDILDICKRKNLFLIEDAAEALGATYDSRKIGSFGDISTFSFFGNKTITSGEGGMVVTNDRTLFERIEFLKNQAASQEKVYWHEEIGFNYRMTNVTAAIGLSQLEEISSILERKQLIADLYKRELAATDLIFQSELDDSINSNWMVGILLPKDKSRDSLINYLKENNIETKPFFYPVTQMPQYKSKIQYPVSEVLSRSGLYLPSYPDLINDDIVLIANKIKDFLN